jgi:hypothetical protein
MKRRVRRNPSQWSEVIEAQAGSGLSARAFCARRKICLHSFYGWRRRLRDEPSHEGRGSSKPGPAFIEVGPAMSSGGLSPDEGWQFVLELGGGMSLTLRRG